MLKLKKVIALCMYLAAKRCPGQEYKLERDKFGMDEAQNGKKKRRRKDRYWEIDGKQSERLKLQPEG